MGRCFLKILYLRICKNNFCYTEYKNKISAYCPPMLQIVLGLSKAKVSFSRLFQIPPWVCKSWYGIRERGRNGSCHIQHAQQSTAYQVSFRATVQRDENNNLLRLDRKFVKGITVLYAISFTLKRQYREIFSFVCV
jgi:hypothetical protein